MTPPCFLLRRQTQRAGQFCISPLRWPITSAHRHTATTTTAATTPAPDSLLGRQYCPLPDILSPTNAHLLTLSLAPYLAPTQPPPISIRTSGELNPGFYLAYFPPLFLHERDVMPDGSDATQSPGPARDWPRRMWAGGEVYFGSGEGEGGALMIGEGAVCEESVVRVDRKGAKSGEKVFVWFERRYFGCLVGGEGYMALEEGRLLANGGRKPAVREKRCLVFMKHKEGDGTKVMKVETKVVKPPNPPDFSLTFTPTPTLLLRFSALTFNAHKIHFDPVYCAQVENHRAPLCHGPLSQVFLLELLRLNLPLPQGQGGKKYRVRKFEYRNLAPMYVGEKYTICGRLKREGGDVQFGEEVGMEVGRGRVYELWAETPKGGLGVKATAAVEEVGA
ncbi:hypothetical protein EV426DRAFT_420003 [Tirmania nivea]|nr:hypothetical protein EV426DRAFT_420003 [Tirmania nivea]